MTQPPGQQHPPEQRGRVPVKSGRPAGRPSRLVTAMCVLAVVAIAANILIAVINLVAPQLLLGDPSSPTRPAALSLVRDVQLVLDLALFVVAVVVAFRRPGRARLGAIIVASAVAASGVIGTLLAFLLGFFLSATGAGIDPSGLNVVTDVSNVVLFLVHVVGVSIGALIAFRGRRTGPSRRRALSAAPRSRRR